MKIYKAEIKDGIGELVQSNASIAMYSEVESYIPTQKDLQVCKAIAENKNQVDLYYMKSILASVGWNKNDDVFDAAETWKARTTPEDKQFNYMHDEKDIIGHITSASVVDDIGNRVDDINENNQLPVYFDVVIGSVLYTSWSDQTLKGRMKDIISDIESGNTWHVSMECLFPAFDYALIDSKGENKLIKREETSAFLTKHLRAYGGGGEYNGYKIGRLLRNFSFSGVGLVKKPANPRSVILNKSKSIFFNESKAEEITMQDDLEVLKAELAEAKEAADKMKDKMKEEAEKAKKAKSETEVTVASLLSQLAEVQEALAVEKTAKEKMLEEMKYMKEKAAMNEEEVNKMKKEKMMMKRKAELVDAGIAEAELEETVAKFESLSDEIFETVLAAIKKVATYPVEKKVEAPNTPVNVYVRKSVQASEEIDANEADASVLETAEADETQIPMAENAEEESIRSFASEWFSKNVLKTTANIK
jgi:hypothetical protein